MQPTTPTWLPARLAMLLLLTTFAAGCGSSGSGIEPSSTEEARNARNEPERFGANANIPFDRLPREGALPSVPWSDDYWATRHGGVSYRWQVTRPGQNYRAYLYDIPSSFDLAQMSEASLARLSPAEKYDLLTGDASMSLTRAERQRTLGSVRGGDVPGWHGLCHGWAPASYMEKQARRPVARVAANGQRVIFHPSDIHALLSRFHGDYHYAGHTTLLGSRCESDSRGRSPDVNCRDTNPGAFHLAVLHHISALRLPFIAGLDDDEQIWNHPVYAYSVNHGPIRRFRILGDLGRARFRARGTAYLVDVAMRLHYVAETQASTRPSEPARQTLELRYSLELDESYRVIGGEWDTSTHPDFLWRIDRHPRPGDVRAGIDYGLVRSLLDEAQ